MPIRTQNYIAARSSVIRAASGARNMTDVTFLYSTAPDQDTAQRIASALIAEKHAACVNLLAPMSSVYEWEGVVEQAIEIPLIVKTTTIAAADARDRIIALHPHDCPCVVALKIDAENSAGAFLDWVSSTTGGKKMQK